MKKILVPSDFSSYAEAALKVACEIAQKTDAEIILLNIMPAPDNAVVDISEKGVFVNNPSENQSLKSAGEKLKESLGKEIQKINFPKDRIGYRAVSGKISTKIVEFAEKEKIDLIVMGTQGADENELLVGSHAEKVVRRANCPVFTLRKFPKPFKLENIVFAYDLEEKNTTPIEHLMLFQKLFNAKLHLLHVNTPSSFTTSDKLQAKARLFAKKHQLENYTFTIYCDYVEDDGINHFAQSIHADLIAIASHKRKGILRLFSGSVSEGVVSSAKIPVLTFNLNP